MKVTSKGQLTIPKPIRAKYGFTEGTDVLFVEDNGMLNGDYLLTRDRGFYRDYFKDLVIIK